MPTSDISTVKIDLHDVPSTKSGAPLSEKKLAQLAAARQKALLSRRRALKEKLEAKLQELRFVLGNDFRPATVEKYAQAIIKNEERLRSKQAMLTEKLSDAIDGFRDELKTMRRALERYTGTPIKPTTKSHQHSRSQSKSRLPSISEVSSTTSRRSDAISVHSA